MKCFSSQSFIANIKKTLPVQGITKLSTFVLNESIFEVRKMDVNDTCSTSVSDAGRVHARQKVSQETVDCSTVTFFFNSIKCT
jgi:hypothetical protein